MQDWQFLDSGDNPGQFNMETDEELAYHLLNQAGPQVLRLYGWSPWAISLGRHQNQGEFDLERCSGDGIDIIRRPTGGRAILHAEELTYSVVLEGTGHSVLEIYNRISRALVAGLGFYGVQAGVVRSQPEFRRLYRQASSVPCFSSSARYEVVVDGRKLVGSAQRRYRSGDREVILQHGSILCGTAHERLADYVVSSEDGIRESIGESIRANTCCIEELTGREVERERLADCIREGFVRAWGISFESNIVREPGTTDG